MPDVIVRGQRVLVGTAYPRQIGELQPAALYIRDAIIEKITAYDALVEGVAVIDAGDAVIMPGLVDTHVHCNEPGRSEWEGFASATQAAAAGGVTTLIDMPLNCEPATTSLANLEAKRRAAQGQCWVDVGFWGGIVPGNSHELAALHGAGVRGFKCFLCHSGIDDFPAVDEVALRSAFEALRGMDTVVLAHAEAAEVLATGGANWPPDDPSDRRRYCRYLASRPVQAETDAVALLIRLCREYAVRTHFVHLSSAQAVAILAAAIDEGLPVTCETCPHYLYFAAEAIVDGATEFKCAPPIREAAEREALWNGLQDGAVSMIASDHSHCPPELKHRQTGDFAAAWGGISSLQLSLPVVWTEARRRGVSLGQIAAWMCQAPAALAGLGRRKGGLDPGKDADLVCWNPDASFTVAAEDLRHRHKLTPYLGERLTGVVEWTMLRGEMIYARRANGGTSDPRPPAAPRGRLL